MPWHLANFESFLVDSLSKPDAIGSDSTTGSSPKQDAPAVSADREGWGNAVERWGLHSKKYTSKTPNRMRENNRK